MSWSSRFPSWGGRFSPFGRGGQSAEVTDKDFEYITSADLDNAASNARASSYSSASEHDVLVLKHRKVSYPIHFPAHSIERGQLKIGELRNQAAKKMAVSDPSRMKLFYRGRNLKDDFKTARDEGLRSDAEILCVVGEPIPSTSQEEGESEDEEGTVDEGTAEARPKRKRNRKTGNKRKGWKSGTASASDATPNGSTTSLPTDAPRPQQPTQPAASQTPLQKLDAIASFFHTNLVPQCVQFISSPPSDPAKRDYEHKRLGETILAQVLLKLDAVETGGEDEARARRKEIVKEANAILAKLDDAVKS